MSARSNSNDPGRTAATPSGSAQASQTTHRTGVIGRLARVGLLAILALSLLSMVDQGGLLAFRKPSVVAEQGVWILTAFMFAGFVSLVGHVGASLTRTPAARWQVGAVAAVFVAAASAATIGQIATGTIWGFPLADLVWLFNVVMLAQTIVALSAAVVMGTPGCEIAVWDQLLGGKDDDGSPPSPMPCIVGLHFIDELEASGRRASAETDGSGRAQGR